MEFWNDIATDKSWEVLLELRNKADFILIGGWACYLLTKTVKSKDIDIVVDYETLAALKKEHRIKKVPFLKKYEMVLGGTSVDIYVPYYSRLAVPAEEIAKHTIMVEGFKIPEPEILLLLKQLAGIEREASVKGQKDRVDILNLLIHADIDFRRYSLLARKFGYRDYPKRLRQTIVSAKKEFKYLGITNPRKIKLLKKGLASRIKS